MSMFTIYALYSTDTGYIVSVVYRNSIRNIDGLGLDN